MILIRNLPIAIVLAIIDSPMKQRILAYQLAQYLKDQGVEIVFGLCGHTNIAFLDAIREVGLQFITSRHEQVAAHIADGYARVTRNLPYC